MANQILQRAQAHYKDKLNTDRRTVLVPEWGTEDEPLVIYVRPANLVIRDKIYKYAAQSSLEALVETIVLRAVDADGLALFTQADKKTIMQSVDPDVVARIAMEISADLDLNEEEAFKEAGKN